MRYFFTLAAILTFWGGCTGAFHHFVLSAVCGLLAWVFWQETANRKNDEN